MDPSSGDFVLIDIAEAKDGWTMGPFRRPGELQFVQNFEVKEWTEANIRREWRNHSDAGNEYITVKSGTLIITFGRREHDGKSIVETSQVRVPVGKAIALKAGAWRKFESEGATAGVTVRQPAGEPSSEVLAKYTAFLEHWKHTDQIRQWLTYNGSMASSVLVAAWAVLYAANAPPKWLLILLALLGTIISVGWLVIVRRATGYYDFYETDARMVEAGMRRATQWPFHRRKQHRGDKWQVRFTHLSQLFPAAFFMFFAGACIAAIALK